MILQPSSSAEELIADLPSYAAVDADGSKVLGLGRESLYVVVDALDVVRYEAGVTLTLFSKERSRMTGYGELLREIERMVPSDVTDDVGRIGSSDSAKRSAVDIAYRMLRSGADLTTPDDVSVDRDGAIRILWEKENRALELVCPYEPSRRPYIFYSDDVDRRIAYDLSISRLNRLLSWLNQTIAPFPK